jgi:hypothetical protein
MVSSRRAAHFMPILLLAAACGDDGVDTGGTAGGAGSGGAGGSPTDCDYPTPATGQGVRVDEILPAELAWDGFAPMEDSPRRIGIDELHDCDGTHGIHALLLSTIQPGTLASENHAAAVRELLPAWHTQGIGVAFLLLYDEGGAHVSIEGVASWRNDTIVRDVFVLADPDFLLVAGGMVNTPQNQVVDPRTMRVVTIAEGHPFDAAPLEALAADNAP